MSISHRFTRKASFSFALLLCFCALLTACSTTTGILSGGGGSWQKSALQDADLQTLAVDPNHLQDIFAGDAQNGVFTSTDSGQTWQQSRSGLPVNTAVNALAFDTPGKQLFAATTAGLYVSSDAGKQWQSVKSLAATDYTTLAFDLNTPAVVYIGSSQGEVWRSTDSGSTWNNLSNGLPGDQPITSLLYDPNLKQLWATYNDIIYRLSNNATSWQTMQNGLPSGIHALALGALTTSSNTLLFAGTDHGFYRTTDAGQHWSPSQENISGLKISAILLDTTDPAVVYIATGIGVLRSGDSGQNWSQLASGLPPNQSITALIQGGSDNSQLILTSRGIYRYPGTGGGTTDPSRILGILFVLLFFGGMLFYFSVRRKRFRQRRAAQPNVSPPSLPSTTQP